MKVVRFGNRSLDVACALEEPAAADRLAEWAALCEQAQMDSVPGGVRLWLHPVLRDEAVELAERESRCCPFLDFELAYEDGRLRFDITSPVDEAGPVIAALTSLQVADPS